MTILRYSKRTLNPISSENSWPSAIAPWQTGEYCIFFLIGISLLLRTLGLYFNNLLVEEAYYWNYAQHLDWGYLDHPPMVALLIKTTTAILGTNELGVRFSSMLCWLGTSFFSYKLTNLISRNAGLYAIFLLAILPFFFLHSLIITPDAPLIFCWCAMLYYLYRSLILEDTNSWYIVGLYLGLGLISKYTILLLVPTTLLYVFIVPSSRKWLVKKEPYLALLIALIFFSPVIYWNATHEWVSFLFQSTRRFQSSPSFSFHSYIGIIILFLMPPGVLGLYSLMKKSGNESIYAHKNSQLFLQIFTLTPLIFFGIYSFSHELKFNWIGPIFLATLPWLASLIKNKEHTKKLDTHQWWLITASVLLLGFTGLLFTISFGRPIVIYHKLFPKFIAWDSFTQSFHTIAQQIDIEHQKTPIFVPLDLYNIGSELSFYQAKGLADKHIEKRYPIIGRHVFGGESLMYRYWSPKELAPGDLLILISKDIKDFDNTVLKNHQISKSGLNKIWSQSPMHHSPVHPYYYQVVEFK